MNIETSPQNPTSNDIALFNLAFRIFFLSAGIFAMVSISLWGAIYFFDIPFLAPGVSTTQWHAHEMIYGYAMAVIAGFLLTAAKNWTGIQTLHGKPLALLFGLWLIARILFLAGNSFLLATALFDIGFALYFITAVALPIIKAKQWKQMAILSKLLILAIFNLLYYLGAAGILPLGGYWGIYGGLFLVISLILTLGRRVVPFFIERGIGRGVQLYNAKWLDISSLVLFLCFTIVEVFLFQPAISAYLALALFLINARRLIGWHVRDIWQKSLLWSLYLGLWSICIGFLLFALSHFAGINKFLAIHAFAFGGVGLMTLGMMSRVSLGHTGRNIHVPLPGISIAFVLLLSGTLVRVFLPLLAIEYYQTWIGISLAMWIIAFMIFSLLYLPILSRPRIDGGPG